MSDAVVASPSEIQWMRGRIKELKDEVCDLAFENDSLRCLLRVAPKEGSKIAKLRDGLPHFDWKPLSYLFDTADSEGFGVHVSVGHSEGISPPIRATVSWGNGRKRHFEEVEDAIKFALELAPIPCVESNSQDSGPR